MKRLHFLDCVFTMKHRFSSDKKVDTLENFFLEIHHMLPASVSQ